MEVEVFLACVLHMFVILNGTENLSFVSICFRKAEKNVNFIVVLIGKN